MKEKIKKIKKIMLNKNKNKNKNKKGMVMIIVLSTIALLLVIVQEIAFDSQVELRNGVAHYHRLRSYHAAKSGLQMALLRITIYKQAYEYIKTNPQLTPFLGQAQPYLNLLWSRVDTFPPIIPEDISDIKKNRILEKSSLSLLKDVSYSTKIESEGAKLDLNGIISPVPSIRQWTRKTLYHLLINLRDTHPWVNSKYSENDIQKITENISNSLHPTHTSSLVNKFLYSMILDLDDLKFIDEVSPELIELIRPYITLYGEYGIMPNFADPLLLQSLGGGITEDMAKKLHTKLLENPVNQIKSYTNLFTDVGMSSINDYYFSPGEDRPIIANLVFNIDAPQNFKIISQGVSNNYSKTIEAIVYDPRHSLKRAFEVFELQKKEGDNFPPSPIKKKSNPSKNSFFSTPFIIYWKDIN